MFQLSFSLRAFFAETVDSLVFELPLFSLFVELDRLSEDMLPKEFGGRKNIIYLGLPRQFKVRNRMTRMLICTP